MILTDIPRGVLMIPICLAGFNAWRAAPVLPGAIALYALGGLGIALAMFALGYGHKRWLALPLLLAALAVIAAAFVSPNAGRVMCGGIIVTLAIVATWHAAAPFDWALAFGLWAEVAAWLIGNMARGNFPAPEALSAIGQAFGPYAWATLLLTIAAGYVVAWRKS